MEEGKRVLSGQKLDEEGRSAGPSLTNVPIVVSSPAEGASSSLLSHKPTIG